MCNDSVRVSVFNVFVMTQVCLCVMCNDSIYVSVIMYMYVYVLCHDSLMVCV